MLVSSLSSSGSPTRFPVPKGLGIMFGIGVGICLRLGLKSFFRTPLGLGRMLHGSGGAVRFTTSVRRVSGLTPLSLLPGWLKTRATALFTLARLLRPTVCAAGGAGPTAYDSPRLLGDCVEEYREAYDDNFRTPVGRFEPSALTLPVLRSILGRMKRKAAGPDAWTADLWLALPTAALERLCQVVSCVERAGVWPQSCLHWRTVCIHKGSSQDKVSRVDKVRPISMANMLYRVWASHVASQLSRFVAPLFATGQGGGFAAPDC